MRKRLVILDKRTALFGIVVLVSGLLGLFGLLYWGIFHPDLGFRSIADVAFLFVGILILVGVGSLAWNIARVERG